MDIKHIPDSIIMIIFSPFILLFCCIGCCNSYCFIRNKCRDRKLRKVITNNPTDDEYDRALLQDDKGGASANYKRFEDDDNFL